MSEKRMLIVPAELVKKIDENRGDMRQADFIDSLIESQLEQGSKEHRKNQHYVTKEEVQGLEQGIKGLLRSFSEFFVSYGVELGKQPAKAKFEELSQQLEGHVETFTVRKNDGHAED